MLLRRGRLFHCSKRIKIDFAHAIQQLVKSNILPVQMHGEPVAHEDHDLGNTLIATALHALE